MELINSQPEEKNEEQLEVISTHEVVEIEQRYEYDNITICNYQFFF